MSQRVGGYTRLISVTPVISTSIYASGDVVGGVMEFENAGISSRSGGVPSGFIQSVVLIDNDSEDALFDLHLFDREPTGTYADQAAFSPTDADLKFYVGTVAITAYKTHVTNSTATVTPVGLPFDLGPEGSLFGVLEVGAAPTYTAATDLTARLGVMQD